MFYFLKSCFYVIISVISILSYTSIKEYYQKIESQKTERRKHLDEYYSNEFRNAAFMMNPKYKGWGNQELGVKLYEEATQNAIHDGYDRADVEIMRSKAIQDQIDKTEKISIIKSI